MNKWISFLFLFLFVVIVIVVVIFVLFFEVIVKKVCCVVCYVVDKKMVGFVYKDVVVKYWVDMVVLDKLFVKVCNGGSGVWGEILMIFYLVDKISDDDLYVVIKWVLVLE